MSQDQTYEKLEIKSSFDLLIAVGVLAGTYIVPWY